MPIPSASLPVLRSTPEVCRTMLEGLPDDVVRSNYGPETFSPFDVVGHLVWGDLTDWLPRARHILDYADTRPFEPFDRYAMFERDAGKTTPELLAEFRSTRDSALSELGSLDLDRDDRLDLPGLHPELGPCTMRQLLATWVAHDLNHISQICKAISRSQYAELVGPWEAYITVLHQ